MFLSACSTWKLVKVHNKITVDMGFGMALLGCRMGSYNLHVIPVLCDVIYEYPLPLEIIIWCAYNSIICNYFQIFGARTCPWWRAFWLFGQERKTHTQRSKKIFQTNYLCLGFLPQPFNLVRSWIRYQKVIKRIIGKIIIMSFADNK